MRSTRISRSLDARRPVRLDREQLAELSAVFPALADRPGAEPPALPAERYRLHRAVCALLAALADRRPLVVLLDDLHWADESSLELVGAPAPPASRGACAARPGLSPPPGAGALDRHARPRDPRRRTRGARSTWCRSARRETVELLAGRGLDPVRCRAIHAAGRRQPVLRASSSRAPARASDLHAGPATVAAAIGAGGRGARAGGRSPAAEAAAVAGDQFDARAGRRGRRARRGMARRACFSTSWRARDLVRSDRGTRARLAFRHPIVRRRDLRARTGRRPPRRACARRRRAGRTAAPPASVVAQHLERCARPGDAAAARVLVAGPPTRPWPAHPRAPPAGTRRPWRCPTPAGLARHGLLVALARALRRRPSRARTRAGRGGLEADAGDGRGREPAGGAVRRPGPAARPPRGGARAPGRRAGRGCPPRPPPRGWRCRASWRCSPATPTTPARTATAPRRRWPTRSSTTPATKPWSRPRSPCARPFSARSPKPADARRRTRKLLDALDDHSSPFAWKPPTASAAPSCTSTATSRPPATSRAAWPSPAPPARAAS